MSANRVTTKSRLRAGTTASGHAIVQRAPVAPGSAPVPLGQELALPHERDESTHAAPVAPDPVMTQAKRDIDAGLVDTDMRGTPGLDASLRAKLVPGPGGKPPGAKDPGMPKLEPAMTKTAELTARVEKMINSSAPKIWIALTTPATLKQFFFGANVVTDWKVGSPIRMQGEFKGKAYEDKGDILAFEPQRQLSFSHWSAMSGKPDTPANYHVVTFDLVPQGAATRVTLSQSNLTGGVTASDVEHRAEYEKNWSSVLDGLAKILS